MQVIVILNSPEGFKWLSFGSELYLSAVLPAKEKVTIIESWINGKMKENVHTG